ncbi:MAG TPA: choice-of-anchor P family protein [Terriglobia bacterium]|jgi:hypothetical protein|nr:choice-of-anchor P family protein [Terriglobia bacterium]
MEKTFLYDARATGVSGTVTLPFQDLIQVQAPSALPITGGYSSSKVENFAYKDILSFRSASTVTTGSYSEADQAYNTLVTATVEGLNIMGVVTADEIVARLTSKHPKDGGEPSIIPIGSSFTNLRIAGCTVDVHFDMDRFTKCQTYSALRKALAEDRQFCAQLSLGQQDLSTRPPNATLLCSAIKEIVPQRAELKPNGNAIQVPNFGTIHLAEFVVAPYAKSITMIRADLGCAVEGRMLIAHVSGNGQGYP